MSAPRTWQFLRRFGKFGAVGAGLAASVAASAFVVNAAASCDCDGSNDMGKWRYNFPGSDFPPFRKWNFNWDRLEPETSGGIWSNDSKSSGTESDSCNPTTPGQEPLTAARRNIILVRHGQYNYDGDSDRQHTLTQLGQEQAAMAGQRLANMGIKFTSITSSAKTRAIETAKIVLENMHNQDCLEFEVNDPLLDEGVPCVPEPPYRTPSLWNPNGRDVLVDGSRIEAGFRKYFHRAEESQKEDSWEIIVCHGNVIRYFSCRALQFPPEGWLRISIDHCSIARFTILPNGEVVLRGLGDSGHIPYDKTTVA